MDTYKPEIEGIEYPREGQDAWEKRLAKEVRDTKIAMAIVNTFLVIMCIATVFLFGWMLREDARSDKEQANDRKTMDAGTYCEKWEGRRYAYHLSGYCFSYYNGR